MAFISVIRRDFNKSSESIKLMEVEETFDIYFSRFFGYYLALISKFFGLSPNQVSVLSLVFGVGAGVAFYFQQNIFLTAFGCLLITFSGVLDSADGQLARMTRQSSDLGRKIDAIIDTLVFVACYVGGALYFLQTDYGWNIFLIAALAGYFHSVKSGVYEYYKTEFIYYLRSAKDHRIPYVEEVVKTPGKSGFWYTILYYVEVDYIRKQAMYHGRKREFRELFENWAFSDQGDKFRTKYSKINTRIMTWWALVCGTNTHRTVLMATSLMGRMDWYFYFTIVTTVFMIPLVKGQQSLDEKLVKQMKD